MVEMVQYFGPKHLEQTTLSYVHFIENAQAKPRQHYTQLKTTGLEGNIHKRAKGKVPKNVGIIWEEKGR